MADFGEKIQIFSELNDRTFGRFRASGLRDAVEHFGSVLDPSFETAKRVFRSAAEVLVLLDSGGNSVLSDRLAIIANLCSYDTRLNVTKNEKLRRDF